MVDCVSGAHDARQLLSCTAEEIRKEHPLSYSDNYGKIWSLPDDQQLKSLKALPQQKLFGLLTLLVNEARNDLKVLTPFITATTTSLRADAAANQLLDAESYQKGDVEGSLAGRLRQPLQSRIDKVALALAQLAGITVSPTAQDAAASFDRDGKTISVGIGGERFLVYRDGGMCREANRVEKGSGYSSINYLGVCEPSLQKLLSQGLPTTNEGKLAMADLIEGVVNHYESFIAKRFDLSNEWPWSTMTTEKVSELKQLVQDIRTNSASMAEPLFNKLTVKYGDRNSLYILSQIEVNLMQYDPKK